jgi:non-ribosomal peptide synthase protein (TIGR01720 family)
MSEERDSFEVAVVGMACRFPGARDVAQFWRNLRAGVESISFFTDEEMLADGVEPERLKNTNLVRAGGVLEGIELFDASFFGFSPREAEILDPQQRFFLECAWEAFEHSGYDPEAYRGAVGVYAGVSMSGYLLNIFSNPDISRSADSLQLALGNDKDYLATRVAYKLNLRGPAITVQSSCSTSLVAAHMACQNLIAGECDMALAGGVNIFLPQKNGFIYQEGGIVAPDGRPRAFDARAQGCIGGSGVGVVVLKRLEDARADGDTIHAIIKGGAVNNDGAAKVGFTAPSIEGQARVIRAAQTLSEVSPETVTYVEAHGTATALGDPIEVAALKQAFQGATGRKNFCGLGSVKTNIGHLDAAAGVAGLMKTVLSLKHREIPPSLNFEEPNPQIDFADSPFYVNDALREWPAADGSPRRAGVSSFGIGGTNAHLILEEAREPETASDSRSCQLLLLSGRTEAALEAATANLGSHLAELADAELADAAYTLQVGRRAFKHRRAVLCHSVAEASEALERRDSLRFLDGAAKTTPRPLVFMFPGQGSQYVGMGLGLYREEPVFREQVDVCAELLRPHLGLDLRTVLYPPEAEAAEAALRLKQTLLTQTSLFVVEYALAKLWESWGVRPQAMIGHSLGEYTAASVAGVFSLEDALRLVATRARLMQKLPIGSMLAVPLAESDILPLLGGTSISLAAVNGPQLSVVSGPHAAVEKLARQLSAQSVDYRELHTSHAFHSEMMEPAVEPLAGAFNGVKLRPPSIPYVSNLTGDWVTAEQATDPRYWAAHMRRAVRFGDGLKTLFGGGEDATLLEVGPGNTLSSLARRHPSKAEEQTMLTSLRRPHDQQADATFLLRTLGQLWLQGQRIDWPKFYEREQRRRVPLPTYPFERQRYWIERQQMSEADGRQAERPSSRRKELSDWFYVPVWKQTISPLDCDEEQAQPTSRWLVFEDECGLGRRLVERLEGEGHEVVAVRRGTGFLKVAERVYAIDPQNREDYDRLLGDMQAGGETPRRLVHMWSVTSGDEQRSGDAGDDDVLNLGFYSLLFLAQALGEQVFAAALGSEDPGEPFSLSIVSNDMQQVTGDERAQPEKATLLGACKVIPQEYPHVVCRSIDVTLGSLTQPELADVLLAELTSGRAEQLVAYRGRRRWGQDFEPLRLEEAARPLARLRDRGVYLITGGLGGVGLELAEYLARTVRARLVLLGRSAFPARAEWAAWLDAHSEQDAIGRKIRRLIALEETGAEVLVLSADVTDDAQAEAAFREASEQFGEINGVIHAAGLPPSSLIQRRTREAAASVLAPKVRATRTLDALVRRVKPDFFMLCSSLRALTGGAGMFDYCAANAFLDAFARARPRDATTTLSINWDGWSQVGLSLNVSAEAAAAAERNEEGMTNEEGIAAFGRVLRSRLPQIVVSTRDLRAVLEQERISPAAGFLDQLQQARPSATTAHPRPRLQDDYVAPRNEVERTLAEIWQELLGIEEVGVNDNFFELGGDSVISLRIIARANQAKIQLSPKQVFEHQTIAELAAAATGGGESAVKAEQGLVTGTAPLTPVQHWFFEENPHGPHHFNQAVLLETRLRLDYDLLDRATRALIRQHDALRHRFTCHGSLWQQFCAAPDDQPVCVYVDLSAVPQDEQREAIEAKAAEAQASLNLTDGPLMRVALFDLGQDRPGRLLIAIHHLVIDAVAWQILIEDLERAYNQLGAGEQPRLPAKTTSYRQWGERLLQYAQSGEAEKELDLWLDAPRRTAPALPVDFPGAANTVSSLHTFSVSLDEEETSALLHEVPKVYQTQINDALLTALVEVFAERTGSHTLLLDLEGHGRDPNLPGVDLSRTVGWFSAIHPVLLDTEGARDYGEALQAVKEQLRRVEQGGIGYGVLRYLGREEVRSELRALPQSDLCFLYLGQMDQTLSEQSPFSPAAESAGPVRGTGAGRRYALEVVASVTGGRLQVTWTYSENLHRTATVEALAVGFADALRALVAHCRSTAGDVFTPSHFADFGWSPADLADIISKIEESVGSD